MCSKFTHQLIRVAFVLILAACQGDAEKIADHLDRGDQYAEAGDPAAAIIEYKNVLQIDPNHVAAHFGLAKAYLVNKQVSEGFWELRETVRLDPERSDARSQLAELLLLAGDPEEALVQSDELVSREVSAGYLLRARALEVLKRSDEALAAYAKAIDVAPDESGRVFAYAQALARAGDREAARAQFDRLVEMDPRPQSYTALAYFLSRDAANDADAEAAFREATKRAESEHDLASAHANLATFYFQRGRLDEATAYLETAIKQVEKPLELIYLLARLHLAEGNEEKANELIEQATQQDPNDPAPYLTLSAHRGRQGDSEGALEAAQKALELDPQDKLAKLRVAEILVDIGYRESQADQIRRGREMVEQVLAVEPTDPGALMVRAKIDLAEQNVDQAIEGLRAALESDPDNPRSHFLLGSALSIKGERAAARTELARSLELDPAFLDARQALARVHALLGEHEYAVEEGRRFLRARPDSPQTRILVAQSLVILGRLDEALETLDAIPEEERDVQVLYAIGRVHLNAGNDAAARKFLTAANEAMPTNADILHNLMRLDRRQDRIQDSVKRVQLAVEAEPDNAKLRTLSGVVALIDRRPDDAEAEFKKAVELDASDAASYEHLARLYTRTGRLKEAVATYEEAIKAHPSDANLHHFLGVLYQFGGNMDKAIENYESAIKYGPDLAEAKNNLAYIYAEAEENLDRALDLAQDAKAALPDSANAADTLGWVLFKRGIPSAAISYLKEAEASSGDDIVTAGAIRHHLAQAYEADGETEEAKQALKRAIASLDALSEQRRAAGAEGRSEPDWAVEARAMLNRLEGGG